MAIGTHRAQLGEVITRIINSELRDVHTSLPGRIKSYNASTQVADVELMIQRQIPTGGTEDPEAIETLPIIPSVPVLFSSGGGFFISFPLQENDPCLVMFCERDLNYFRSTGNIGSPSIPTTHTLNGAVCIPVNLAKRSQTIGDASSTDMVIGKDGGTANLTIKSSQLEVGGNTDAAALASKVDKINSALRSAVVGSMDGGATYKANIALALDAGGAWGSSASSKLKLED